MINKYHHLWYLFIYLFIYFMHHIKKKGFTLVELIVVITILAILWTIAFISLQWYSENARDTKRVADVNNIKKALEFFVLNSEIYPMPDEVW